MPFSDFAHHAIDCDQTTIDVTAVNELAPARLWKHCAIGLITATPAIVLLPIPSHEKSVRKIVKRYAAIRSVR